MKFSIKKWKSAPVFFPLTIQASQGHPKWWKMSEKLLEHFEVHSFCKVYFLKIFIKNIDFQTPWRLFLGSLPRSCTKAKISSAFASRSAFCFYACCAIYVWVCSVAVKGRVLRTPLGHNLCSYNEQSRFWHGRGIIKFDRRLFAKPSSSILGSVKLVVEMPNFDT